MINVKVDIIGNQELILNFKDFGKDINLISEPLENSARFMQQQAIANFAAQGSLLSGGWQPLKKSTIQRKAKQWPGAPMMVRTGLLKRSFEIKGPRIEKDSGEIEVYNPVFYAKEHQEGRARLPQRILLRFQKQQVEDITNIFDRWLEKIINKDFK